MTGQREPRAWDQGRGSMSWVATFDPIRKAVSVQWMPVMVMLIG
jgi:hypothetical protein